ncbi:CinA family protein [Phenylobacterium deserti]|uniref:CinA family protein n=1 Tax=Phenylobacterium deserti TaxID=1914756 RepID=A0A328ADC6_9CAUL|nr:CinA family protein [Phenylobacterium deserti]RAK50728.1 CinA family protein [Phenylobacterium deserti]
MAEALDPAIPRQIDDLAQEVLREACERELMISAAESCTGGLLASLLTDIPGQSHAFERGFVTYTNEAKNEMLGVSMEILDNDGAVSERAAVAMAEGALAHSRADLAVSITGFAEGGPGQPAGLVHFACASKDGATHHVEKRFGDIGRAQLRVCALETALMLLRDQLAQSRKAAA